ALERAVRAVEARLGEALAPFRSALDRLITMPGVSETVARVLVAEIGFDMTRFATAGHLVSWAGLCPRLAESAGKRRSTWNAQLGPSPTARCWAISIRIRDFVERTLQILEMDNLPVEDDSARHESSVNRAGVSGVE